MKLTNLYWPANGVRLALEEQTIPRRGRPQKLDRTDEAAAIDHIISGFWNWSKLNFSYKQLLANLDIKSLSNSGVLDWCAQRYTPNSSSSSSHPTIEKTYRTWEDSISNNPPMLTEEEHHIIYLQIAKKWSIPSLSSRFWRTEKEIMNIFANFK